MANGGEDSGTVTHPGPPANVSAEELQTMMRPVTLPPTPGHAAARSATPAPPPARTATPAPQPDGSFGARVKGYVKEAIDEALQPLKDKLDGLGDQLKGLSDRMDVAGQKDDTHDGELTGLKKGLEEAEEAIKTAQSAAEAAQKAVDAVSQRLTDELGGL